MDWQPIETAPTDTSVLLGWYDSTYDNERPVSWTARVGIAWTTKKTLFGTKRIRDWHRNEATHWKPLPAPPEAAP